MKEKSGKISILGKTYSVDFVDFAATKSSCGLAYVEKQKILISHEQGKEAVNDTLIHEILHVIDGELRIGLTEKDICHLAVGLHSAGFVPKLQESK